MSNRRDIHDFLDGSLDPEREDELFKNLGSSEEVRREFNEQTELHRAAKKIASAVSVPAAAREELFKNLDITATPEIPIPVPATSGFLKMSFLMSGFIGVILVGILQFSGDSTAVVTSHGHGDIVLKSTGASNAFLTRKTVAGPENSFKNSEASLKKRAIRKKSKSSAFAESGVLKTGEGDGNTAQKFTEIRHVAATENATVQRGNPLKTDFSEISFSVLREFFEQPLQLQFRSDAAFKNITASALYQVSAADKFGVEIGYEEFRQEYDLTIEDEIIEVDRTERMPVFSIAYRRDFTDISFKNISPFAQVNAGGTSEGGLLKGMVGLEFSPVSGTHLIVGAETAAMPFKKQNRWFIAPRANAVVGFCVQF